MCGSSAPVMEAYFTADDEQLIKTWRNRSSWIWTIEDTNGLATSPNGPEQRAFRKTYIFPNNTLSPAKVPQTVTIVIAADDYFALYVDGVLRHEADPGNRWSKVKAFNFPLSSSSAADGSLPSTTRSGTKLVLGIRVINTHNFGGLKVAGMIHFNDSSTTTFFSGEDESWLGETLFDEGWEQPDFAKESRWKPATVIPFAVSCVSWPDEGIQLPQNVSVCRPAAVHKVEGLVPPTYTVTRTVALPKGVGVAATQSGSASTTTLTVASSELATSTRAMGAGVWLTPGQLAGALLGAVLLSALVVSLVIFYFAKRLFYKLTPRRS